MSWLAPRKRMKGLRKMLAARDNTADNIALRYRSGPGRQRRDGGTAL